MGKIAAMSFAALVLFSGGIAVGDDDDESAPPTVTPDQMDATVTVATLHEGALPGTIRAFGRVRATQQIPASLSVRVAGVVAALPVHEGDQVKSGAELLRMDARTSEANAAKAKSDLAVAAQELAYAESRGLDEQQNELDLAAHSAEVKAGQDAKEAARLASLLDKQLVSERAATEARQAADTSRRESEAAARKAANFKTQGRALELERARGRVNEARAAVNQTEIELASMTLRAPADGRVARIHVNTGQTVDPGAPLIEFAADQATGVEFGLSPAAARRVRTGDRFVLTDHDGAKTWSGAVVSVGGEVDPESGLVRVQGIVERSDQPAPFLGQILRGEITVGESVQGLLAPESALSDAESVTVVHVVDANQLAHRVAVEVVGRDHGQVAVKGEGLTDGAVVVTDGNYNLPDGARVKPHS